MALRTKVKYGLSAAMLALIAAGASAPQLLDQFLQEREGNMLVAVRDNGGVWSVCRGVTRIDGKPVVKG
ncbi:lysozyme, partial [Salmonella enterica subsp. enterica serovar Sandiego]|nr:lysozyme [Salmonella enterica subsp. enterica serovar Sandiego]